MNFKNYFVVFILFSVTISSSFTELYNNDFSRSHDYNISANTDYNFLQNSYGFHEGNDKNIIDETKELNKKENNPILKKVINKFK